MSRKHRQGRGRRGTIAWPIIAFGAILIIGAVWLFARQSSAGASDQGGTPQIAVDQSKIDYGYVKFGETRSFRLAVTNNGNGPLLFKTKPYVEVLEGC